MPTKKCSVLMRKRQCSLFMLLKSSFPWRPACNPYVKLHSHRNFSVIAMMTLTYLGITVSLHLFSQHLVHRICNSLWLRNTLSLNFSLTPRLSKHRIKERYYSLQNKHLLWGYKWAFPYTNSALSFPGSLAKFPDSYWMSEKMSTFNKKRRKQ